MTRRARLALASVSLLLSACAGSQEPAPRASLADGRYVMGTVLEATLHGPEAAQGRAVLDELFAEAQRLEGLVSTWDPATELSRVNREGAASPQPVSPEVAALFGQMAELSALRPGR